MSWTDKKAVETIKQLRDKFKIWSFVETGTFKGINARLHAGNFPEVLTCELMPEYFNEAKKKLEQFSNVKIINQSSPDFLKNFVEEYKKAGRTDIVLFYLDAHFYDAKLPKEKRFVVLDELRALKGFKNGIIIIHDFDNGLGHITYDGIPLDLELIKKELLEVNPDFKFYTNELATCEVYNEKTILDSGMVIDWETMDNIRYANSTPRLTYRGILYALPTDIGSEIALKKIKAY